MSAGRVQRPRPDGERLTRMEFESYASQVISEEADLDFVTVVKVVTRTWDLMFEENYGHGFFPDRGEDRGHGPRSQGWNPDEVQPWP